MIALSYNTGIKKYMPFFEGNNLASKVLMKGPRFAETVQFMSKIDWYIPPFPIV